MDSGRMLPSGFSRKMVMPTSRCVAATFNRVTSSPQAMVRISFFRPRSAHTSARSTLSTIVSGIGPPRTLLMKTAGGVSRTSPCDVPQGYASVAVLPAALPDSLSEQPANNCRVPGLTLQPRWMALLSSLRVRDFPTVLHRRNRPRSPVTGGPTVLAENTPFTARNHARQNGRRRS
jgi:hypothetical protein